MKRLQPFRMLPAKAKRSILFKYTLYQIPDAALATLVLWVLVEWANVSPWLAGGLAVLWILKDIALFPFLWQSAGGAESADLHSLIGEEGLVTEKCDPDGYVLIRGEIWKARSEERASGIDKGARVEVTGSRGLTLYIRPKES